MKHVLKSHYYPNLIEAGCDEAGRGCLAGSVFAAAVILPSDYDNHVLNDSKPVSYTHLQHLKLLYSQKHLKRKKNLQQRKKNLHQRKKR